MSIPDGRVHFTGLIETVSDVPGHIWDPLARNSDLRSDRDTAKPMVRQPKLCEDLLHSTLKYSSRDLLNWGGANCSLAPPIHGIMDLEATEHADD